MKPLLQLTAYLVAYGAGWLAAFSCFQYLHLWRSFETVIDEYNWFVDGFGQMSCMYFLVAFVLTAYLRAKRSGSQSTRRLWNGALLVSVLIPLLGFTIWFLRI